jgi:Tfp pilus assembly protein PilF
MRTGFVIGAIAALALSASVAQGQPPEQQAVQAGDAEAEEAQRLLDAGNYKKAALKFRESLTKAPKALSTTVLGLAESLYRLGKLPNARKHFREGRRLVAAAIPRVKNPKSLQRYRALDDLASSRLDSIEKSPRLTLTLESDVTPQVLLDGDILEVDLDDLPVEPGQHEVSVRLQGREPLPFVVSIENGKNFELTIDATLFAEARYLMTRGRFRDAISPLRESLERESRPETLLALGTCLAAEGDPVGARRAVLKARATLEATPNSDAAVRREADKSLESIESELGRVELQGDLSGCTILVDGRVDPDAGASPLFVNPGRHRLEIRHATRGRQESALEIRKGATLPVPVVLSQDPAYLLLEVQPAGAAISIDGVKAPHSPRIRLGPGRHEIVVAYRGYYTDTRQLHLKPGYNGELSITLEEEVFDRRPIWWTVAGVGGAMAGAGVVTWFVAESKTDALEDDCRGATRSSCDYETRRDGIDTLDTASNVLVLGGAGVAVIGASGLLFDGREQKREMGRVRSGPTAVITPGFSGVTYARDF